MAHIKNRLRGLLVAFVALVAALAIVPGVAQAMDWVDSDGNTTGTGSIQITGLDADFALSQDPEQPNVVVYKVADIQLKNDSSNTTEVVAATGLETEIANWSAPNGNTAVNAAAIVEKVTEQMIFDDAALNLQDGTLTISNLPAGIYFIDIIDDEDTAYQNMIAAVEPARDPDNTNNWVIGDEAQNTEVVAVKSSSSTLEKTVTTVKSDGVTYVEGDDIDFQVSFSVGANMAEFYLTDEMTGLTFNDDVVLHIDGAEYSEDNDPKYFTVTQQGEALPGSEETLQAPLTFRVTLTEAGIAACAGVDQGKLYITYSGKVNDQTTVSGGFYNKVTSSVNTTGDEVEGNFAGIQINKFWMNEGEKVNLEGAVFGVYDNVQCNGVPITKITSDFDGVAKTAESVLLDPTKTYYVKEISAPAGFKLIDTVFKFIPAGESPSDANTTALIAGDWAQMDVENTPSDYNEGINLPQTGGMGTVALTAAGVVLVAGAAAFIVRSRKEN